tara:strand:+ start:172 stop:501 length:330 start_codon:yes stop_codon:yes gene_type:complete
MTTTYHLKRNVMDPNRIRKIAKKLLEECTEDRSLALETYAYFKEMVDNNPTDGVAKNLMTDCLKLAQTSKVTVIKLMDLVAKIEALESKKEGSSSSMFGELAKLTDEKK